MGDVYIIKTKRLGLRSLLLKDIEGPYQDWLNNPVVCEFNSHCRFPQTPQDLHNYIVGLEGKNDNIVLALIDLEKHIHIGNISLQNIDLIDRNAEMAFLMGETDYWGKGYAFEAASAIIDHAFKQLNLHRIYLGTADNNLRMQKLAIKLGFHEEGRRREALYKNGIYHDIIEYGIVREDE